MERGEFCSFPQCFCVDDSRCQVHREASDRFIRTSSPQELGDFRKFCLCTWFPEGPYLSETRCCVGVGNLIALEEFFCNNCLKLEGLPNLGRLRRLRILEIGWCGLISEVPGLGDLEALEELRATDCEELLRLSDMRKLVNLQVLKLEGCESITEMPGVDSLISLEVVEADFRAMDDMPNLGQLTKLRKAYIDGWNLAGVQGLSNLKMLRILRIGYCTGADELPDLRNLTRLQEVTTESSEFKDVSGLSHSSALESVDL